MNTQNGSIRSFDFVQGKFTIQGFASILVILAVVVIIGGGSYLVVNREVLKDFFQKGDKPTAGQFSNTINSNINLVDDRDLLGLKQYDPTKDYLVGDTAISQNTLATLSTKSEFTGVVYTGASQGQVKKHCSEGLYLAVSSGLQLNARQTLLLLRDTKGGMITNQQYVNKSVKITGVYPDENQARCEALICGCEEYLTVETITIQ